MGKGRVMAELHLLKEKRKCSNTSQRVEQARTFTTENSSPVIPFKSEFSARDSVLKNASWSLRGLVPGTHEAPHNHV